MKENRRHPVIVGVGQVTHREKISGEGLTPVELAGRAVDAAVTDSGSGELLGQIDSFTVVNMFSETMNPTGPLCDLLGIEPSIREYTSVGGHTPQWILNRAADKIAAGEIEAALLVGAEALYSENRTFDWRRSYRTLEAMAERHEIIGSLRKGFSPHEEIHYAFRATRVYPLFENALRVKRGLSIEAHRNFLGEYCAGYSRIAADNPYAWFREPKSGHEIANVTDRNRMICFPYTKFMNPIMGVNQAAAVILTSADTAKRLSISPDKRVYPLAGVEAEEKWLLSDRLNYYSSPAIREMASAALEMADLKSDRIDFADLYSCFPSASMIAASEIGLDTETPADLTLTGGLPYFGGPGNNYSMHAIAHAVERIRKNRDETGLVTAVGLYLTKHALGIYGGREPEKPWDRGSLGPVQERIDGQTGPELCTKPKGKATVETYTVVHDRENEPVYSVIIARLEDGRRCFAQCAPDRDLLLAMESEEFVGRPGAMIAGDNGPNRMEF